MGKQEAGRASGTRWFDETPTRDRDRIPVPPGESDDLHWPDGADAPASDERGGQGPEAQGPEAPPADAPPTEDGNGSLTPATDREGDEGSGGAGIDVAPLPQALFGPWPPDADEDLDTLVPDRANDRWIWLAIDVAVVAACALFVFLQMGPSNLFADTTPSGGDMGAHVWGPAYLRDQLLPNLQLAGWAPAWYAGFPAYQFYMVVPSLLIVLLDLGVEGPLVVLPVGIALVASVNVVREWSDRRRRNLLLAGVVLALACVGLPYGVAFKLVAVSGVVSLPVAAYAFGRLSGLSFPTPAVLAVATLPFLFYRGFSIYGGNIASTLAGEFAFSISLSLGLVYLGVLFRGFETGRHRGLAAVLLALTGLCHLIPAIWAIGATVVAVVVRFRRSRAPVPLCLALGSTGLALGLFGLLVNLVWGVPVLSLPLMMLGTVLLGAALWLGSQSARWLTPVFVVGGLLSAFWVVPFLLRRTYLNDMGWEKLPYLDANGERDWWQHLVPSESPDVDLRWAFALAMVGAGLSIAQRHRVGMFLTLAAVANGLAFWLLPQGRLWNARVLPFYYLTVILLAGLAVVEAVRLVAQLVEPRRRPTLSLGVATAFGTLGATLLYVGLPLGVLPSSDRLDEGGYGWPSFSPLQFEASPESFVNGWADWNFTGYEGKDSYREYYEIVTTMGQLGEERGCGRAFWEYQKELDRYGTPMALMLLPYWTDGCIGSMEGLYFEASATTPYHFLMQTELSVAPSAAQRDMPYGGFDISKGVQHLQLMGVRYYMATTPQAIQAASGNSDLTQVARSGPWVVYEVADGPLVTGLISEPAVIEGIAAGEEGWMQEPRLDSNPEDDDPGDFFGPAVQWFQDPNRWNVLLAADGPPAWQRVEVVDGVLQVPDEVSVPEAEVSNIDDSDPERISFDVDIVGSPVLVKASYFPNWQVDGALGPWRVAPNLMVVVPTENHVELHYENTSVEWLAYALTFVGFVGLVGLVRRGRYRFRDPRPAPSVVGTPPVTPPLSSLDESAGGAGTGDGDAAVNAVEDAPTVDAPGDVGDGSVAPLADPLDD